MENEVSVTKLNEINKMNESSKNNPVKTKRAASTKSQTTKTQILEMKDNIEKINLKYELIVDEFPQLRFQQPKINNESDLINYQVNVMKLEEKANEIRTLENLKETWAFFSKSLGKINSSISLHFLKDPKLAAKHIRFSTILVEKYDLFKPTLIELIKKHKFLQIGKLPPEIKFLMEIHSSWAAAESREEMERYYNTTVEVDNKYDDL